MYSACHLVRGSTTCACLIFIKIHVVARGQAFGSKYLYVSTPIHDEISLLVQRMIHVR